MKKTYWVMKNPGSTAEWIEMNGKQFYEFINSPVGKGRYFIDFDIYEIEVSREEYCKWKREANHSGYLQAFEDEALILSLDSLAGNDGISYEGLIADLSVNIEDEIIRADTLQLLGEAVLSLADDERWLITELFFRDKPKTEQEITKLTGIPQQTVSYRKNKILEKLKILLVRNKKVSNREVRGK